MKKKMNDRPKRCALAMFVGVSIGGLIAAMSIPVHLIPTLLIGLLLGTLMAASESSIDT